jgi:hypothetical protein
MRTLKQIMKILGLLLLIVWILCALQTRANANPNYIIYLPIIPKLVPPPLVVANFDSCNGINNLGGEMGAAYEPSTSNKLTETYEPEMGGGCVVKLDYEIPTDWGAFWLKLMGTDLSLYNRLSFDVKFAGQVDSHTDMAIKVEFKNRCDNQVCDEVWIQYVSGITTEWERRTIFMADFYSMPDQSSPPTLTATEELVFTFENGRISSNGVVYLDNISFEP